MQLTPHFSLEEFTRSQTAARNGLNNTPSPAIVQNLVMLCRHILEPLRIALGRPLHITSGYRSPEVNKRIGGETTSQHCQGMAADFVVSGMTPDQVFEFLRSTDLPFDQSIQEFSQWNHVSFDSSRQRGECLIATYTPHGKHYEHITRKLPASQLATRIAQTEKTQPTILAPQFVQSASSSPQVVLPEMPPHFYAENAEPLPVSWSDAQPPIEQEAPAQIPDFAKEIVKNAAGWLSRHALSYIGGGLSFLGFFASNQIQAFVTANEAKATGIVMFLISITWAAVNSKRLFAMLRTALHLPSPLETKRETTIADVRQATKDEVIQ